MSQPLQAQDPSAAGTGCTDPQLVLACQGEAKLTQVAIDGAFSRIPEKVRLDFIRDGAKVDKVVKDLLRIELISRDAEQAGFSQEAVVQERVLLAARAELAAAWMEELVKRAPDADYVAMAHENYLANPAAWSTPVTVDVTHILISTDQRTVGQAEAIAMELSARLAGDPEQFGALVLEYSDDPGKVKNGGKYTGMKYEQLVKPFAEAAFALQNPGEISQPVETEYGYHLIRLDSKHSAVVQPWELVEKDAVEKARAGYQETYRINYLQRLMTSPVEFPPGSIEVMAKRWFGEDLAKAPIFTEDGVQ
ncbi:MAG: peptidylprolyl isomerase [Lysobacterales bacterium]